MPNVSARVRTKSTNPGDAAAASYMSAGPIAVTWYGGARYAELTSTEPPMSMIAVDAVTRSPLTATRLGAREPQLLDDREDVLRPTRGSRARSRPGAPAERVLSWMTTPGPRHRDQARGHPRLLELAVEVPVTVVAALPRRLELLDAARAGRGSAS